MIEKELINFNVPVNVRNGFKDVCRMKGSNMTSIIIDFMRNFINEEGDKLREDFKRMKKIEYELDVMKSDRSNKKYDDSRIGFFKS